MPSVAHDEQYRGWYVGVGREGTRGEYAGWAWTTKYGPQGRWPTRRLGTRRFGGKGAKDRALAMIRQKVDTAEANAAGARGA